MADPIDFIPDSCEAGAIAQCVASRADELATLNPLSIGGSTGLLSAQLDGVGDLTIEVNAADSCLLGALSIAFQRAGKPFPVIPPPLQIPDFSECITSLDDQVAETVDPIGALSNTFNITFDENDFPIRIQASGI